jgi:hypothetical protein
MSKLSAKIREELLEILPPTIYFFVALHIVAFIRVLMLKGTGIAPVGHGDDRRPDPRQGGRHSGHAAVRFPQKPLLHNVAWKTAIPGRGGARSLSGAPRRSVPHR